MTSPRSPGEQGDAEKPVVFISYIHDNEQHRQEVLDFASFLVGCGIDVILDRWAEGPRQDWSSWALGHIPKADYVIIIASEKYRLVGDGLGPSNRNLGGQSEAAVLRELLHGDRQKWLPKLAPVLLPGHNVGEIPLFLQPLTADHYTVTSFTEDGADSLLRMLTGQPRDIRPTIGPVPVMPPRSGPGPTVPQPGTKAVWTDLDVSPHVAWRSDLLSRHYQPQGSLVELHLVPVGRSSRTGVRRLETLKDELAILGRAQKLFTTAERIEIDWNSEAGWAYSTEWRSGEAGLAVLETGQRTCWFALPRGKIGAVLDARDLVDRLVDRLNLLARIVVPAPQRIAPAIGLNPVGMVRLASLSELSANTVSIPINLPQRILIEPREALPFADLSRSARTIAEELAARLAAALRATR